MVRKTCLLFIFLTKIISGFSFPEENNIWVKADSSSIPPMPFKGLTGGAFTGVSNNTYIIAGGFFKDLHDPQNRASYYSDSIFICLKKADDYSWKYAGKLPYPVAFGGSVTYDNGVLCIGGQNNSQIFSEVFMLRWDMPGETITIEYNYPPLPVKSSYISAAIIHYTIYVAGGIIQENSGKKVTNNFLNLVLDKKTAAAWQFLDPWPGPARCGSSLVSQSNGEFPCLFLFGGKSDSGYLSDAYMFDPRHEGKTIQWKRLNDMPFPVMGASAVSMGGSQVFVFSGSNGVDEEKAEQGKDISPFPKDILSYNTITDVWYKRGELPYDIINSGAVKWDGKVVIPGGEIKPGILTSEILTVNISQVRESHFSVLDYSMLFIYLSLIAWLGYYFSSKNKSSKDFFLGGQKIPFWAAGLSMMAAQVSSIGFMAIPAKSFATNWSYFAGVLTWFIVVPVVIYAFVPFYRRLNVTSAYEYLEKRFNSFIRVFIATLYLLFQLIGRLAAIIFLPAIALSAVTGMNAIICILIIGCLATAYTVLGGMHAVIWIDVIQALVLFGGIILCITYIIFNLDGGVNEFIQVAWNDKKFSFGTFDINLTTAVFWVIIVGNIFNRLGTMSTDQSVVQRYLTTRDEKETARALWTDVAVSIPWALFVFGLGTALYVFYKANPGLMDPNIANDEIVPFFIGQNLPSGISGIIIAGIFAASMSSVDSSIHSSTTVLMRDFLHRKVSSKTELRKVALARWITGGLGLLGTVIAIIMTFYDIASVWDIVLEFAGLFTGAMTGVFILGIFSVRANGKGAIIGALTSAVILLLVKNNTSLHFFLYSGIGIISCVIIGYMASFFFKDEKPVKGLTIFTI